MSWSWMPHHGAVTPSHSSAVNWSAPAVTLHVGAQLFDKFPFDHRLGLGWQLHKKLKLGATWWNRLLNYSRCCSVIISFLSPRVAKAEITFTYSKEEALKLQNNAVAIKCTNNFQRIHYLDIKTSSNYFQLQLQQTNRNRNVVEMGMWELLKYENSWCNSPNSGVCYFGL